MTVSYLDAKRVQGSSTSGVSDVQDFLSETSNATSQLDESANKYGVEIESTNPLIGKALESFTMMLRIRGSPTGSLYAKKYNSSGTLQATSTNYFDISTLPPEDGTSGNGAFGARTWNFASGQTLADGDRIVFEGGSHDGSNQITFQRNSSSFTDTTIIALYTSSWTTPPSGDALYKINETVDDKATLLTTGQGYADFNGSSQSLTSPAASDFKFMSDGSAFSMAFWVYRDSDITSTEPSYVGNNGTSTSDVGFALFNTSSGGGLRYFISNGTALTTAIDTTIASQTWTHIAITYGGSAGTITVYKDGVSVGTFNASSYSFSASNPAYALAIGKNIGRTTYVDARIADIGFWNIALSAGDIAKLKDGTRITSDGTGFDYAEANLRNHLALFSNLTDDGADTKSWTNGGTVSATTTNSSTNPPIVSFSNLPENTIFNETDTYKQYWLQDSEWKNTYANANILSVAGSNDGEYVTSYSDASGWGAQLATYPFDAGTIVTMAGNADNAIGWGGDYYNNRAYKYYGASNTYSADVGASPLYDGSNGSGGGDQDNMIIFGGNKGGGSAVHTPNSEKSAKYTSSAWTVLGDLSKKYRETGGGAGTPDSALLVCGESGGSSFDDYDSVENYSGASDTWSVNSTAFPVTFNNGICFGTATAVLAGMGDSQSAAAPRSETYYTTNSGDTWSSAQNNTYDAYGVGCAGTSSEAGLAWCGSNWATSTLYSTTNGYSLASGWATTGNSYAHTTMNVRGCGNAGG